MSEFTDWFYSVPFFTRYWFACTCILSTLGNFSFISPRFLLLNWASFYNDFHIWRPLTALFFDFFSFHFLVNLYFLYSYSERLETGMFAGKPADYFTMLIFNWLCCVLIGFLFDFWVLMSPMVISVLYVWCQLNKDVVVTFWFGTRFKAMYLPWVLMVFNMVAGGGGKNEFAGIIVGHLAFFLLFKYPREFGGPELLKPPSILKQWFPDTRRTTSFGLAPESARNPVAAGGHAWGRGYTLGGN